MAKKTGKGAATENSATRTATAKKADTVKREATNDATTTGAPADQSLQKAAVKIRQANACHI